MRSPSPGFLRGTSIHNGVVIRSSASRVVDGILVLFMAGIGVGLIYFVGGILSWVFCALFFMVALLPLDSCFHPETYVLSIQDGILTWHRMAQGKECRGGGVPINDVTKIYRHKSFGYRKLTVVRLFLETKEGELHELPPELHLAANEKKIVSAILDINPSIVIICREGSPLVIEKADDCKNR